MAHTENRRRHEEGLRRFVAIRPSRVLRERLSAEAVEAGIVAAEPIQAVLELASMYHGSGHPDFGGRLRASLGPHPFVVLAWAREHAWGDRDNIDRDVAAWAVWTFCQIPRRGQRGRPIVIDTGDAKHRISPEAIGIVARPDVLKLPELDAAFSGYANRSVAVNAAIRRIEKLVTKQLRKEASPPDS